MNLYKPSGIEIFNLCFHIMLALGGMVCLSIFVPAEQLNTIVVEGGILETLPVYLYAVILIVLAYLIIIGQKYATGLFPVIGFFLIRESDREIKSDWLLYKMTKPEFYGGQDPLWIKIAMGCVMIIVIYHVIRLMGVLPYWIKSFFQLHPWAWYGATFIGFLILGQICEKIDGMPWLFFEEFCEAIAPYFLLIALMRYGVFSRTK